MESKIAINASGEKLFLGNDIITLNDLTRPVFETNDLQCFTDFIKDKEHTIVFISESEIKAFELKSSYQYLDKNIAFCKIQNHPALNLLREMNGKQTDVNSFSVFLERMKSYLNAEGIQFKDAISDLKIKKVIDIQYKNDRRGNFLFNIKAEKSGNQDYNFPLELAFNLPIITNLDTTDKKYYAQLSLNFFFKWSLKEENLEMLFMLESFDLTRKIEEEKSKLIDTFLKSSWHQFSDNIYKGDFRIISQTDQFKYLENKLKISQ